MSYRTTVTKSGCTFYIETYREDGRGSGKRATLRAAERSAMDASRKFGEAFVTQACDSKRFQRRRTRVIRHCVQGVCEKV